MPIINSTVEAARSRLAEAEAALRSAERAAAAEERRPTVHVTEPVMTLDFNPAFIRIKNTFGKTVGFKIVRGTDDDTAIVLGEGNNLFSVISQASSKIDTTNMVSVFGKRAVNNMLRRIYKGAVDAKWLEGFED